MTIPASEIFDFAAQVAGIIDSLSRQIEKIRFTGATDASHWESSIYSDAFHLKSYIANRLEFLLQGIGKYHSDIGFHIIHRHIGIIDQTAGKVAGLIELASQRIEQKRIDASNPQHSSDAEKLTADLKSNLREIELNGATLFLAIKLAHVESIYKKDIIEAVTNQSKDSLRHIEELTERANSLIEKFKTEFSDATQKNMLREFSQLESDHKTESNRWFWVSVVIAGLLAISVFCFAFGWWGSHDIATQETMLQSQQVDGNITPKPVDYSVLPKTVESIVRKVLLISFLAVLLKVTLKHYNTERHLYVLYSNRVAAMLQYGKLESNISASEHPSIQSLRLEMAKLIFSDPATGMIGKDSSHSEVNISPIMHMIEKVAK